MTPDHLGDLRARSVGIQERWKTLLRLEPVSGPLANPDALVHLIPETLERIFELLAKPARVPISILAAKACVPKCDCGNNPYLAYFVAAEQAFVEAAVLQQSELAPAERRPGEVAEVMLAVRRLARMEIDTFCGACVHRCVDRSCRHLEKMSA